MNSAFRTFFASLGVGAACYVLAMASWQQVLFFFLFACLGWCLYVWSAEKKRALYIHPPIKFQPGIEIESAYAPSQLPPSRVLPPTRPMPTMQPRQPEPMAARPVYSFPMHKLKRAAESD